MPSASCCCAVFMALFYRSEPENSTHIKDHSGGFSFADQLLPVLDVPVADGDVRIQRGLLDGIVIPDAEAGIVDRLAGPLTDRLGDRRDQPEQRVKRKVPDSPERISKG